MLYASYSKFSSYPFEWLENLIEITLNPAISPIEKITSAEVRLIRSHFSIELRSCMHSLRVATLTLANRNDITTVAENYFVTASLLDESILTNLKSYQLPSLLQLGEDIHKELLHFLTGIKIRYGHNTAEWWHSQQGKKNEKREFFKMLINLSGDQIAILIRAAFEQQLIDEPSKRAAFRAVAPFLSTARKTDLSEDSLRSNAGRPETKDIDKLVQLLNELSTTIQDYKRKR